MAQTTTRTATQIISAVLKRIGNETIVAEAQVELNSILDRLYADFRWPFLKAIYPTSPAVATVAAGESGIALPTDFVDFWDRQSFYVTTSPQPTSGATTWNSIAIVSQQEIGSSWPEFNDSTDDSGSWGTPGRAIIDYNNLTFAFGPWPNQAYDYQIVYRKKYVQITNFALPVNFPNEALLEQMLFAWACQFEDDDRAVQEMQIGEKLLRQFLKSFNVGTSKNVVVQLRPSRFSSIGSFR